MQITEVDCMTKTETFCPSKTKLIFIGIVQSQEDWPQTRKIDDGEKISDNISETFILVKGNFYHYDL